MDNLPYEKIRDSDTRAINENYDVENYDANTDKKAKYRDLIAFFIIGLINNYAYVVMLSAAEDLISTSASIVLLADILPSFIVQTTAPWWMARIPYTFRVFFIIIAQIASFLLPAFSFGYVGVKLTGVVFASLASGFGEITFLALSGFYPKQCVVAFSSGTGGAGIAGALTYMFLRYFLNAKWSLLVSSPIPLVIGIGYFAILSAPEQEDIKDPVIMKPEEEEEEEKPKLTIKQQLSLWWKLMPYMVPLFVVYFGEYLINQGIDPDLIFYNSKLFKGKSNQYRIYQSIYQVGVFISRSSATIFPVRRLWIPAVLQLLNAIILTFAAVFGIFPSIWIAFAIIFWEGLLGGCIYVNAFYLISQKFTGQDKEFALGATSMSYGLSITIAAVVGIFYQPLVKSASTHWARHHKTLNGKKK